VTLSLTGFILSTSLSRLKNLIGISFVVVVVVVVIISFVVVVVVVVVSMFGACSLRNNYYDKFKL
jgi:hypothetical protein